MSFDFHDTVPIDPPNADWMPLEHQRPNRDDSGWWLLMGIAGLIVCAVCLILLLVLR